MIDNYILAGDFNGKSSSSIPKTLTQFDKVILEIFHV